MPSPPTILFEDAHLLAVDKPAGLLTQGFAGGEPTLERVVRAYLAADAGDPASIYLGTVHRLDRPVSGVILWAKTPKAARRLADGFARREASKEYWAIVEGRPDLDRGLWRDHLCPDETAPGRSAQVCRPGAPRARLAVTRFALAEAGALPEGASWLKLWPETGRTHQLRVQSSARGLPILGDRPYGSTRHFPEGIALHAAALRVRHPVSDVLLAFEAQPPPAWAEAGCRVGGDLNRPVR